MPLAIENLKKIIKWALDFTKQIATAYEDKKITLSDLFGFFDEATAIPGLVKSWPAILAELKDLTPEERLELHAYVKQEFDIPNDKLETFIENSLLQVTSLVTLVEEFKALKQKPPTQPIP